MGFSEGYSSNSGLVRDPVSKRKVVTPKVVPQPPHAHIHTHREDGWMDDYIYII